MSRTRLHRAADEVDRGSAETAEAEVSDRLRGLADQLRTQAERTTTPALGALDRIQHALDEIAAETDDETVSEHVAAAREEVFSFLETLDDRGMKQHGGDSRPGSNVSDDSD